MNLLHPIAFTHLHLLYKHLFLEQSRLMGLAEFASTQKGRGFTSAYTTVKESNGKSLYFPLTSGSWKVKLQVTDSTVYVVSFILLLKSTSRCVTMGVFPNYA